MFYVLFESTTPPSAEDASTEYYLKLQKLLEHQEGFISETPFVSTSEENKAILVAKFVDENAARAWRKHPVHLQIQKKSREEVFSDYRIQAGPELQVTADEGSSADESVLRNDCRTLVLLEHTRGDDMKLLDLGDVHAGDSGKQLIGSTTYENATSVLQVLSWESEEAARKFFSRKPTTGSPSVSYVRVVRDYGKSERKEAPKDTE